jgi:hypothetical protein
LSENIKFICTCCKAGQESSPNTCYHFLPPLNMNQVPEKLNISWSVTPKKNNYQVNAIWLLQQNQCRIKFIISSLSKQKYIGKLLWKWLQYVLSKADGFHTYSLVNPQYRKCALRRILCFQCGVAVLWYWTSKEKSFFFLNQIGSISILLEMQKKRIKSV